MIVRKVHACSSITRLSLFVPVQLTGTPPGPSWSSQRCRVLQESSQASSPSLTSPPLSASTVPSLQGSCFSSPVSLSFPQADNEHESSKLLFMSPPALCVLLAMAIYTGVTVNFLGKRFGDWRFSWSYILGWVALLMTFFAGQYGWIVLVRSPACWSHGARVFCFCRYILHVCLQDAWMPPGGRLSLTRYPNRCIFKMKYVQNKSESLFMHRDTILNKCSDYSHHLMSLCLFTHWHKLVKEDQHFGW